MRAYRRTAFAVRKLASDAGLTIIEMLIAAFVTAIVAGAGFEFYANFHGAGEAQSNISELQHLGRNSLLEIRKSLRIAGYNLTGHVPYRIAGDSLAIYYTMTQPVDSIHYYIEEYNSAEYATVPGRPVALKIYKLMKRVNAEAPMVYADFISDFNVVAIDSRNFAVTITAVADRADDKYVPNSGFRTFTLGERILLRNVKP